jgi:hypothetical protein
MRRQSDEYIAIIVKDVLECSLTPLLNSALRLPAVGSPEVIFLRDVGQADIVGKGLGDPRSIAPSVECMVRYSPSERLVDIWAELDSIFSEHFAKHLRCFKAPGQRASVDCSRQRDLGVGHQAGPNLTQLCYLLLPFFVQSGIRPHGGPVSIQVRPVILVMLDSFMVAHIGAYLPSIASNLDFEGVVIASSMASYVEDSVRPRTLPAQVLDIGREPFPRLAV